MDIISKLKTRAEQFEVLQVQDEKTTVIFEANKLKASTVAETSGTAVRVVSKGKLGFAATTDDALDDKLIANALESAAYGEEIKLQFPSLQPSRVVKTFDPRVTELPIA